MANTKWEYKTVKTISLMEEHDLNEYGVGGWQLTDISKGQTMSFLYTFRRPIMDSDLSNIIPRHQAKSKRCDWCNKRKPIDKIYQLGSYVIPEGVRQSKEWNICQYCNYEHDVV